MEERYMKKLGDPKVGQRAYSVRLALGSLIIQNMKNLSDRDTVAEVMENPYLQYFIGLPGFVQEQPFDPSRLVHFRRRLGKDVINEINELIAESQKEQSDMDSPSFLAKADPHKARNTKSCGSATPVCKKGSKDR